jgi:hypothetical protein
MMPSTTNRARLSRGPDAKRVVPGAPAGYDSLRLYLPSRTQRRVALGVTENTIISWDEHRAERVRGEHEGKVAVLLETCERIRPFFAKPSDVETFLITPQLILGNREPYGLIRLHGRRGAEIVADIVRDEARRASQLREKHAVDAVLGDEAAWSAIRKGLSDAALKRLKESEAQTARIRKKRGSRDMLT